MSDAIIRPVEPRDKAAIAALWQALSDYHVELDGRMPVTTPGAAERYAERLIERRDDQFTRAFVAEVDGQVVGYILGAVIDLHPDLFEYVAAGFIADVYVDLAYRRQGIARELVTTINAWFADQGVRYTELQVAAENPGAIQFWRALRGREMMIRMRIPLDGA